MVSGLKPFSLGTHTLQEQQMLSIEYSSILCAYTFSLLTTLHSSLFRAAGLNPSSLLETPTLPKIDVCYDIQDFHAMHFSLARISLVTPYAVRRNAYLHLNHTCQDYDNVSQ